MKTSLLSVIAAGVLVIALPAAAASSAGHAQHWHKVPTVDPDKAKHDTKTPAHTGKKDAAKKDVAAKGGHGHHATTTKAKPDVKPKGAHSKHAPKPGKGKPARHGRHADKAPVKGRHHHTAAPAKGRHAHHPAKGKPHHGRKPATKHGRHSHAAPAGHVHHWRLRKHGG